MLRGEALATGPHADQLPWEALSGAAADQANIWLRAQFDRPQTVGQEVSYALDLSGLWKGQAYFNGFHLGRHYLLNGSCTAQCAPPVKNGHCYEHWHRCGEPTQKLYHVPMSLVQDSANQVVLFEEGSMPQGGQRHPEGVHFLAIHDHPY